MSSVPAPRIERLPISPRTEASAPDSAAVSSSLRLVVAAPDLYPGLFAALRAVVRNAPTRRALGASRASAEIGRATGARV